MIIQTGFSSEEAGIVNVLQLLENVHAGQNIHVGRRNPNQRKIKQNSQQKH